MRKYRLKSLRYFDMRPMPWWGADLSEIDFQTSTTSSARARSRPRAGTSCPRTIRGTWEKLGIPEAEQKYLGGVSAQYESEVVSH